MLKEFREFILKGNALDLAVGIIIGAAFTAVVNSLVADLITPFIGLLGGLRFDDIFILLRDGDPAGPYRTLAAAQAAGAVTINIGLFLNTIVNLIIVGFVLFLIIRSINRLSRLGKAKEEAAAAAAAAAALDPVVVREERMIAALEKLNATMERKA
ncbi:MAG: large conductance mechanosensitive channel protein MscL [bacterium]|nr:large conductance mechanosensitive channel protein MscL [bacterium]